LFAFRFGVLVCALVPLVVNPRLSWLKDPPVRSYAVLGAIWVFWGGLTALWAGNIDAAVVDTLAVAFGFLTALALVNLRANTETGLRFLLGGWMAGAMLAAVIATWELTTGRHLPSKWVEDASPFVLRFVTVATFSNPNNYGAFLLLVTPMLLFQLEHIKAKVVRWLVILFLVVTVVLSVLTTSKVAVIGIAVVVPIYLFSMARRKIAATALVLLVAVGGTVAFINLADEVPLVGEFMMIGEEGVQLEKSNLVRLNLVLAGIDMAGSTYGVGVGGGNFRYLIEGGYKDYYTGRVAVPHNWWVEVLSQYGIVVFSAYVGFIVYMFALSRYLSRQAVSPGVWHVSLFLVAFTLAGFATSYFVLQPTNWLYVATMLMMISAMNRTHERIRSRDPAE